MTQERHRKRNEMFPFRSIERIQIDILSDNTE